MRKIHTNTKIFFSNPFVLRLDYPEQTLESCRAEYSRTCRKAYKLLQGTWGHTSLEVEQTGQEVEITIHGFTPGWAVPVFVPRGYFCFKDEEDLLQFMLSVDTRSVRCHM